MTSQFRTTRRIPSLIIGLVLGLGIGILLFAAHVSGRLAPFYHALGLHAMDATVVKESAEPAMSGHAGHGGMAMPRSAEAPEASRIPGYATVILSPERQQLIGVRRGKVARDRLRMSIRAVGIIEVDQTRLRRVQTRVKGWVTRVDVNFVGQDVKKGDPLLEIYSPDLLATQEEYLIALGSGDKSLIRSALRRLALWDVPADEIRELEKTKKPRETLLLRSPITGQVLTRNVLERSYVEPTTELYRIADLSVVWLQVQVYEYEMRHIEVGQPVRVTLLSQPEVEQKGKVSFIEPVFQEMTRTVKVRVELKNRRGLFKPGMYANAVLAHDMGEGLLVPDTALLRTGDRALAFRVLSNNRFEPVEVKVGSRFGERWQVLEGLNEGDEIVTSAIFLIDAESRLKSAASSFGGHQHGGVTGQARKPPPPAKPKDETKPPPVHEHMIPKDASPAKMPHSGHVHDHHEQ
jgi:Cu(I)/Ag(I) efflux system membrane fusion protein